MLSLQIRLAAHAISKTASRSLSTYSSRVSLLQPLRLTPANASIVSFNFRRAIATSVPLNDFADFDRPRRRVNRFSRRQPEPSKTLFVANVPFIAEEGDIRSTFESFGEIESVRINVENGRSKGSAHITFVSLDAAKRVVKSSGQEPLHIFDRPLRIEYGYSMLPQAPPCERLYVVKWDSSELELRKCFGDYQDEITDVFFPKNQASGRRFGSAFVSFPSVEIATKARNEAASHVLDSAEPIKIFFARPRRDGQEGPRGYPSQNEPDF